MAIRPYPLSPPAVPSPARTHPPYSKRFRAICPAPVCPSAPACPFTATWPPSQFAIIQDNHIHKAAQRSRGDECMPMIPFIERFPDLGGRETRSVTATQRPDLPDGEYGFVELYCDEPGCDCRRVTIDVLRPETGWSKIWATISYGWESLDFYRTWGGVG